MWESEAFVRDFLQNLKVEDVKTKLSWKTSLSCETSFKFSIVKYSEDEAWTFSSTAGPIRPWFDPNRTCFETIRRTSFPTHLPRHVLFCKTQHFVQARYLSNMHFVQDFSQNPTVEDVRKRSFRARLPSKSESGRCENEALVEDFAFVRDFLQNFNFQV